MALALGLENKRNVAIVLVLFGALFGYVGYLIYQSISGPPVPSQSSSAQTVGPTGFRRYLTDGRCGGMSSPRRNGALGVAGGLGLRKHGCACGSPLRPVRG